MFWHSQAFCVKKRLAQTADSGSACACENAVCDFSKKHVLVDEITVEELGCPC